MPKYLWQTSYTAEGFKGLLREGASSRVAYMRDLFEKGGGKLEAMYWAFGDSDVYMIGEVAGYVGTSNLNDVTAGSTATCTPAYLCTAEPGYDGPTGVGTPWGTTAF
jgi:uncharacterized protein with GYD domain